MQIHPSTPARILRTIEASQLLGLSPSTLEKLRCLGGGPKFAKLGPRAVGYFPDDLLEWARGQVVSTTSEIISQKRLNRVSSLQGGEAAT